MNTAEKAIAIQKELLNIREFTTPEERANLNVKTFAGWHPNLCFYGQMTGRYSSERGQELRKLSKLDEVYLTTLLEREASDKMAELVIPYLKGETDELPTVGDIILIFENN